MVLRGHRKAGRGRVAGEVRMPRHPDASTTVRAMAGGVFSRLAGRIAALEGEVYPLHVGDTWLSPATGARMEDLRESDMPGLHRYCRPMGHPTLVRALSDRRGVDPDRILVSAEATGGLSAAAGALLDPGDGAHPCAVLAGSPGSSGRRVGSRWKCRSTTGPAPLRSDSVPS